MPLNIVQSVQKTFQKYDWTPSEFQKEGAGNVRYLKQTRDLCVWQSYYGDTRCVAIEADKQRLVLAQGYYSVVGDMKPSYSVAVVPLDRDGFDYKAVVVDGKTKKQGHESYVYRFVRRNTDFPVVLSRLPTNTTQKIQINKGR